MLVPPNEYDNHKPFNKSSSTAITIGSMDFPSTGDGLSAAETPLLSDVVPCSVDFKGHPSFRSKSGGWKSASFILGAEMAERFCYFGISSNLVTYLTGPMGQSTAAAAANWNAWYGTAALSPFLGALLADSYLGRFRMIICSSLLYIFGLGFLALSAALNSSEASGCKIDADNTCYPSNLQVMFFFLSLYLVALAQGGYKPCVQAFGADQFDLKDSRECKSKSSFFNWFLWCSSFGTVLALSVLNYIQDNLSWELGFGIPSLVMCFVLILISIGTPTYRFTINEEADQECAHQLDTRFLETSILAADGSNGDDVKQAKSIILKLAPILCTSLGYSVVFAQPATLFTKQASTMDRHIGRTFQIPAASLQLCIPLSVMAFLLIYDGLFVPICRHITKKPSGISELQRVGIGLLFSLLSIVVASVVEMKRLATAQEYGLVALPGVMIPMSVWWLAPQYLLSGISDVLTVVGLQEFFYDQVPSSMKSISIALYLSIFGIGNFLSSILISFIQNVTSRHGEEGWFSNNLNRAHLDYFYWLLSGLSAFLLVAYVYFAKTYVYHRGISV